MFAGFFLQLPTMSAGYYGLNFISCRNTGQKKTETLLRFFKFS